MTYARFYPDGGAELHFAPMVCAPEAEIEDVPPLKFNVTGSIPGLTLAPQTQVSTAEVLMQRPGYASLFPKPPRFEPAEEPKG